MKYLKLTLILLLLTGSLARAQQQVDKQQTDWYIGLRAGAPFGLGSFTAFGADKTRIGFAGGLYGGYRFSSIFSLEASAMWRELGMSADKYCAAYWLGEDGNRYISPVIGMSGTKYSDLYSSATIEQYGVHLNVNVLGFFAATKNSRWSVNLSPAIYGVNRKATVKHIASDEAVIKGKNLFHLGIGADLMAEYRITDHLLAGIYTGITHLTGAKMDAMPTHLHNYNMTWESGIRIGWRFGKGKSSKVSSTPTTTANHVAKQLDNQKNNSSVTDTVKMVSITEKPAEKMAEKVEIKADIQVKKIVFPVIYFSFNRWNIKSSQSEAFDALLNVMRENPTLKISIIGYTDSMGSDAANKYIAAQRAEAVKKRLVKCGVTTNRIATEAYGVDKTTTDASKARRAEIKEEEKQ